MKKVFKLSIVVPIYNVELYLNQLIKSIVSQTIDFRENIELILVNDGSTDKSEQICEKWLEDYPNNIVLITQENQGASVARNNGIKVCSAEWVTFIDGDDFIEINYIAKVLSVLENNPDIEFLFTRFVSYFEFKRKTHSESLGGLFNLNTRIFKLDDNIKFRLNNINNAFFKKSLLNKNNVLFNPEITLGEDFDFAWTYLLYTNKLIAYSDAKYFYRIRDNKSSIMNNIFQHPEKTLTKLQLASLGLLEKYKFYLGYIPKYLGTTILIDIVCDVYNILYDNQDMASNILIAELDTKYIEVLKKIFLYFDIDNIFPECSYLNDDFDSNIKIGMANLFKNVKLEDKIIFVDSYDVENSTLILKHITTSSKLISFFAANKSLEVTTEQEDVKLLKENFYHINTYNIKIPSSEQFKSLQLGTNTSGITHFSIHDKTYELELFLSIKDIINLITKPYIGPEKEQNILPLIKITKVRTKEIRKTKVKLLGIPVFRKKKLL